ncbi:MAG: hypothetical protein F6K35_31080 [Okeania sp. SIO2H7]|nr:hypothetical protein [Okeania sp. SIO2H7]
MTRQYFIKLQVLYGDFGAIASQKTANKKSLGLEGLRDRNYQGASTMLVL